jgi:hypothetical protein
MTLDNPRPVTEEPLCMVESPDDWGRKLCPHVGANGTLGKEEGPPGLGGPPSTCGRTYLSAEPATSRATAEPAGR